VEIRWDNLVDDPGIKRVITRPGINYLGRIRSSPKVCTFLMMYGNTEGKLASPYVVYEAEKLWLTRTEKGAGYRIESHKVCFF
jgi:hypothetical protein